MAEKNAKTHTNTHTNTHFRIYISRDDCKAHIQGPRIFFSTHYTVIPDIISRLRLSNNIVSVSNTEVVYAIGDKYLENRSDCSKSMSIWYT